VLTSATLATRSSFRYIRQRLGLDDARELLLGSPFDYRQAALILLPTDLPEPNHRDYPPALQSALVELCRASQGRALALFTSHAALRTAHAAIRGPLGEQGIAVLGQGIDGTPTPPALAETQPDVVLGRPAGGVDVVGESVAADPGPLPFTVPSEPLRRPLGPVEPSTNTPCPRRAALKQGFGRLIRSKTDRGVVVVLDRRIKARLRAHLPESLPPCQVESALEKLSQRVVGWLERKTG
jgi:DNA polymerase-3 subunit epsilon/ATP-dependent DNA helicase DinG